jgi:hypothetical protein
VKKNTPKDTKKYTHLTLAEREEIAICLSHGMTQRAIAGKLNRNSASVSREILRNNPKIRKVHYRANHAQLRSGERKEKSRNRKRIPNEKILYDQPEIEKKENPCLRPLTVEAFPAPVVKLLEITTPHGRQVSPCLGRD